MKTVGSRELKIRLGSYLRLVKEGATILVTDRGEPIAELRPLPLVATESERRLRKVAATGLLTRPTRDLPRRKRIRVRGGDVSDTIVAERRDRF
jgi:prevent-host-death family protein